MNDNDIVLFAIENSGDLKIRRSTSKKFPKTLIDLVPDRSVRDLVLDIFGSKLFYAQAPDGDVYILSGKPEDEVIFGFLVSNADECSEDFRLSLAKLNKKPPKENEDPSAVKFSKLAPAVRSLAYASGVELDYKENELKGHTLPRAFEALRVFSSVFISLHNIGVRGRVTVTPIVVDEECGFDVTLDGCTLPRYARLKEQLLLLIKQECLSFHKVGGKYTVRYVAYPTDPSFTGDKYAIPMY